MLKNRSEQIQSLIRLGDIVICVLAFLGAYWLRTAAPWDWNWKIGPLETMSWMLGTSLVLHFVLYPYFGFYESLRLKSVPDILIMILKALIAEFFILGTLVFLIQAKETSRYFFGLFLALNYALVGFERIGARVLLSSIRRRGYNFRQVLIVGTGRNAARVIEILRKNKHWGYVPFALLRGPGDSHEILEVDGVKVIGDLAHLENVVKAHTVDEIYIASERFDANDLSPAMALTQRMGIPARFSMGFFDLPQSKVTYASVDQLPVITFYTTLMTPFDAALKRVTDILISIVGLIGTGILYPWIAWRIGRESPGPIIFKQVRVGENGRRFKCYKFRTMYADAEARKNEITSKNVMEGPLFKVENDPRITAFGAFLRRTSLDELPQFFNILRGDMSVVGTRPPTLDEVEQYQAHYRRRLSIRPGLTGLWQVSGRNRIQRFEDVLALDLQYIDNWSIWLDLRIVLKTLWVALTRRGAY